MGDSTILRKMFLFKTLSIEKHLLRLVSKLFYLCYTGICKYVSFKIHECDDFLENGPRIESLLKRVVANGVFYDLLTEQA